MNFAKFFSLPFSIFYERSSQKANSFYIIFYALLFINFIFPLHGPQLEQWPRSSFEPRESIHGSDHPSPESFQKSWNPDSNSNTSTFNNIELLPDFIVDDSARPEQL